MSTVYNHTQPSYIRYARAGSPCPKCGGQILTAKDIFSKNYKQCLQCGYEPLNKIYISDTRLRYRDRKR